MVQDKYIQVIVCPVLIVHHMKEPKIQTAIVHLISVVLIRKLTLMEDAHSAHHIQLFKQIDKPVKSQFALEIILLMSVVSVGHVQHSLDLIYLTEKAVDKITAHLTLS